MTKRDQLLEARAAIGEGQERVAQALTDAQKFYCEGYRAGKAAAMDEIVRCKDCGKCVASRKKDGTVYFYKCDFFDIEIEENDFCSYGERRADDATD